MKVQSEHFQSQVLNHHWGRYNWWTRSQPLKRPWLFDVSAKQPPSRARSTSFISQCGVEICHLLYHARDKGHTGQPWATFPFKASLGAMAQATNLQDHLWSDWNYPQCCWADISRECLACTCTTHRIFLSIWPAVVRIAPGMAQFTQFTDWGWKASKQLWCHLFPDTARSQYLVRNRCLDQNPWGRANWEIWTKMQVW